MSLFAEKTRVPVSQSRMQIEQLLERHKAQQYTTGVDYEGHRGRVQFKLHDRIVRFTVLLPAAENFRYNERYEQAMRQKWRALLLVVKAKLESVENGIAAFEDEFLAQIVMPNDQTVGELARPLVALAYKDGKMPIGLLGTGK